MNSPRRSGTWVEFTLLISQGFGNSLTVKRQRADTTMRDRREKVRSSSIQIYSRSVKCYLPWNTERRVRWYLWFVTTNRWFFPKSLKRIIRTYEQSKAYPSTYFYIFWNFISRILILVAILFHRCVIALPLSNLSDHYFRSLFIIINWLINYCSNYSDRYFHYLAHWIKNYNCFSREEKIILFYITINFLLTDLIDFNINPFCVKGDLKNWSQTSNN